MLTYNETDKPIVSIGNKDILFIDENSEYDDDFTEFRNTKHKIKIIPNPNYRSVFYVAGPSGSGKTSFAVDIVRTYKKLHPRQRFYLFSRTNYNNDPAFTGIKVNQVMIDENLIDNPIDIEKDIGEPCIILFDDCNTIQNKELKSAVDALLNDILEVGRKLEITVIVTNHLVIPNEKKMARTILNEMQYLTVFPKSGSAYQIKYVLKQYFGLSKQQIDRIMSLDSRWIFLSKSYPLYVVYEYGVFIL